MGKNLTPKPPVPIIFVFVFFFTQHTKYHLWNMLMINRDINQQDMKIVDLHFVKSE